MYPESSGLASERRLTLNGAPAAPTRHPVAAPKRAPEWHGTLRAQIWANIGPIQEGPPRQIHLRAISSPVGSWAGQRLRVGHNS